MRTILIDDERLARKELAKLLDNYPEVELIGEAMDADEGIEKINELRPDLLFLDISMPVTSGFDMLLELDYVPQVIFVTAYDAFALKAFEVNALDYILKPVDDVRLGESIKKAQKLIETTKRQRSEGLLTACDSVFVKDGEKCWFVKLNEVHTIESVGNYAQLYFGKEKPLIHRSLNQLTERLDERTFFRANRKQIINLTFIDKIEPYFNGGLNAIMKNGNKVEISRRQSVKFKDLMSF